MASRHEPTLQDLSRECNITPELIWTIEPDHNSRGGITIYNPLNRFPEREGLMLHEWGEGPFCRFKIPERYRKLGGVYLLVVAGKIVFAGWCRSLVQRMNQNYGTISHRKCFEGSEPENCLVNNRVLMAAQANKKVTIYLIPDAGPEICEDILNRLMPEWNMDLSSQAR
jgi:hypothetical protein